MAHREKRSKLRKLPAKALEKTVKALELPPDMLSGMAHFELSGNREAVVDGCRSVLEYDEDIVRLKAGKLTVCFSGRGLTIRRLRKDSCIIQGFIESVKFTS